ncbi:hypothetical protein FPV67DRAFT_1493936 [Lyophyllum atratum]|nr:hypothetical protein FPV67DRAFT_1493936 [Lyophyllum atratum]
MGSCLSCFRGEIESTEREPLLPKAAPPPPPPRTPLDKAVDILAASQSGKLPSQDQLNAILRSILGSSLLQCSGQGVLGAGPLSENGRRVVNDIRDLFDSILQLGMEKNMDNRFQDLLYQCSQIEGAPIRVEADIAIEAGQEGLAQLHAQAPTHNELMHDTTKLITSLKVIGQLLLTSAAFRLLLCDMFSSARELVSQVAADIGNVALQVQVAAEGVERATSIGGESLTILTDKVGEAVGTVFEGLDEARRPSVLVQDTTKDTFILRVQSFMVRAHQDPRTLDALRSLLYITRKYAGKFSRSADIISETQKSSTTGTDGTPAMTLTPKSETSQALEDFKTLLERLASGHSLDTFLCCLGDTVSSIAEQPSAEADPKEWGDLDLQQYLNSVDHWLCRALSPTLPSEPLYASSRAGTRALENLYDGGHILFLSSSSSSPASTWTTHLHSLLDAYDAYTTALTHDRSTMRLVKALSNTHADLSDFGALALGLGTYTGRRAKVVRDEALRDLVGWVIPRVAGVVGRIGVPMPRVEYKSERIEAALDALRMGPGEVGGVDLDLVPDGVVVRTYNEVSIDMDPRNVLDPSRTSTSSRVQVHVEGIRLGVKDLGGLLSVDIGSSEHRPSSQSPQGLSLDIDIALDTAPSPDDLDDTKPLPKALFEIIDVRANLPSVRFKIDKSRHWVLNKLLVQPLAGPIVTRVVRGVLEARIRACLEGLAVGLAGVREEAWRTCSGARRVEDAEDGFDEVGHEEEEPTVSDYWKALLKKGPNIFGFGLESEEREGPVEVKTHTSTTATLKGVVHTTTTTTTLPASDSGILSSSEEQLETETSVAIGAGPMLVSEQAGPAGGEENKESVVDRVMQEVEDTVVDLDDSVGSTVDRAVQLRGDVERAEERREERKELERSRDGWRSRAFDIL